MVLSMNPFRKKVTLLTAVLIVLYACYCFLILNAGASHLILGATGKVKYKFIPSRIHLLYLYIYDYGDVESDLRDQPLISFALAGCEVGTDCIETKEVIKVIALRGREDLELRYQGLTRLHEAILYGNLNMVKALISLGSDVNSIVKKPESNFDGLSAYELSAFLAENQPSSAEYTQQRLEIKNLLKD